VIDVLTVPDGFEQSVREPERQDVECSLLAQEVVDAEDLGLVERGVQRGVEVTGGAPERRSVPNGFSMMILDRSTSPARAIRSTTSSAALGGTLR